MTTSTDKPVKYEMKDCIVVELPTGFCRMEKKVGGYVPVGEVDRKVYNEWFAKDETVMVSQHKSLPWVKCLVVKGNDLENVEFYKVVQHFDEFPY